MNNPTVQPPYTYGQMDPGALTAAIQRIWANGSRITRPYYDIGATTGTDVYNWVIRWLVYKRFRYTDKRNQKRTVAAFNDDDDDEDGARNGMTWLNPNQELDSLLIPSRRRGLK